MNEYRVKKNDLMSWDFTSKEGTTRIKENAIKRLESLPDAFNINGVWSIVQLVDNGTNIPDRKFIASLTI